jgi:hypothetical protein
MFRRQQRQHCRSLAFERGNRFVAFSDGQFDERRIPGFDRRQYLGACGGAAVCKP